MQLSQKAKRNSLIALALVAVLCVFSFTGCISSIFNISEVIPNNSFAVINIQGTIQSSNSSGYNHAKLLDYIDNLIEDDSNKGILLKVNSGGGTVYHSDEMYLKLMEYKEITNRPIHAYFEQTAASGAYYISCTADYISANRNCWTGSIGVILSYTNMHELYDKVGLEEIIISSGENKGMGSSAGILTDEQRAIYQSLVDESYETFVNIVAKGRNMDIDAVRPLADGRIYTATQAKENGLIDEVCLYDEAYAKMEELTGATGYEVSFYEKSSLLDYLLSSIENIMPKSDLQTLKELSNSELNGVLLYHYK